MLQAAKEIGFDKIIATPHVMRAGYDRDKLKGVFSEVSAEAKKLGIELFQGYEYNCYALNDDGIERALEFCTEGTKTILLEFKSTVGFPANWESIVMNIQRESADIIIAHPERYVQVQSNIGRITRSVDMGCKLQLDALSLIEPGFMNKTKKCAKKLLESGMVSYIASDAHCQEHYLLLGEVLRKYNIKDYFEPQRYDEYRKFY